MTGPVMRVLHGATEHTPPDAGDTYWIEHLRTADLSVGTYSIRATGTDDQGPHGEDEIYVITGGAATLDVDGQRVRVAAGSVVYVAAHTPHHFTDIETDLTVLVVFAPPYSGLG